MMQSLIVDFPQMMLLMSASGQPHTPADTYRRELPTDNTAMMHLTFTVRDAWYPVLGWSSTPDCPAVRLVALATTTPYRLPNSCQQNGH